MEVSEVAPAGSGPVNIPLCPGAVTSCCPLKRAWIYSGPEHTKRGVIRNCDRIDVRMFRFSLDRATDNPLPMNTMTAPPAPKGHFLLGHLPRMRNQPLEFMTECARLHGDFVHLRVANIDAYLLSHPDLVEEVLVTSNRNFIKPRLLREAGAVLGNGLLTSEGDFWLRQRRLMQPAFHRDRIASYGVTMVDLTREMLAGWHDGETLDIHEEMMRLTLGIVAKTLFGADVVQHAEDFGAALEVALQRFIERMGFMRLLDALPLPRNRRFKRAIGRLDEIIYGIIAERRENGDGSGDLLSLLLGAQDEDGSRMTDLQLRDEAITLFLAGHETTAIALSWTLYLLSLNPGAEARLVEELEEVLKGREPRMDDMATLQYTDRVVRESMRLFPPAWRVGREAVVDCEIGGYHIGAGAQLIMSQWVIQRDPRFFDDPEAFRPERWDDDLARRLPRFAYFPFGGGARRCIGDGFAMMEATLLLASIVQRFHLSLVPDQSIVPFPSITMRPKYGIRMTLKRR
jgi:cytochrome P450